VDEPGEFAEGGDLEDLEAAGFAGDPVAVGWGGGDLDRQECLSYFGLSCFRGSHGDISIISVVVTAEIERREKLVGLKNRHYNGWRKNWKELAGSAVVSRKSLTPEGVSYRAGHIDRRDGGGHRGGGTDSGGD
jgi:hypothetical protein